MSSAETPMSNTYRPYAENYLLLILAITACKQPQPDCSACKDQLAMVQSQLDSCRATLAKVEWRSGNGAPAPAPTSPSTSAPIGLYGTKLITNLYADNEVAADNEVKGKRVHVVGYVDKISKAIGGRVFVELAPRIKCNFGDDLEGASLLKPGNLIVADCVGVGTGLIGSIHFEHCKWVQIDEVVATYPGAFSKSATGYKPSQKLIAQIARRW